MGIIGKQTIQGTIYSYAGVLIGFITTAILFPRLLSTGEIGLLKLLVSFSVLFAQFGSLGFSNVINRLFPYFRDKDSGHQGFLLVALLVSVLGFLVSAVVLESLKPFILANNQDDSGLFLSYFHYLLPLIFFTLFFNLFDAYVKALYDAVIGTFLKELLQRIFILAAILIYAAGYCEIDVFVFLYVASLSLPTVILLIVLIVNGQMKLKKPGKIFDSTMWKELLNLCLYGILAGFGTIGILQLDSILVNHFMGISQTGIYATCLYFATIILIPSRPLIKISTTILADAWKNNDIDTISLVYRKSCINQAVAAVLIFIGLWVNIDNIFRLVPAEFAAGKWVIFFAGLANVVEMSTGINSTIIQTSRFYRLNTLLIFFFLVLLVISAIILIPVYGLTGMALSLLLSMVIINGIRFVFLKKKYNLNPFSLKQLIIPLAGGLAYLAGYFIPEFNNYIIDILIRSTVTAGVFFLLIIGFNVSEEISKGYKKIMHLVFSARIS